MIAPIDKLAKEPLMDAPSGNGYLGVLLYDDIEDKVQCHECGEWFNSLGSHLAYHGINSREYKEKYELNYNTALTTPSVSRASSVRAEFMYKLNHEQVSLQEIREKAQKNGKKGAEAMQKKRLKKQRYLTVEMMNKYGSCPRQVEEKFIQAVEKIGHTPSWDELYKHDPALLSVLYRRFKGYSNALVYFGLKSKKRVNISHYDKKTIELALIKFVDDFRRLPNPKDTKAGYLPDYMTIARHFESWMNAKEFCFNYLKKTYPSAALVYDDQMRRIAIMPPFSKRERKPDTLTKNSIYAMDLRELRKYKND